MTFGIFSSKSGTFARLPAAIIDAAMAMVA
jgi:hypothetical protein